MLLGSGCGERADRNGSPIREGGVLRVLRPAMALARLPRGESPEAREAVLIRNFAKDHDVEIEWVEASLARLADELLERRAGVAIGRRSRQPSRKRRFSDEIYPRNPTEMNPYNS